jgi:mRNA-degrading endonuclease RelE of RelBE toxin-antitoxin system
VRVKNSDVTRGKSGGYRIIYYLQTERERLLVAIYSKSDQGDIPHEILLEIIEQDD